MFETVKRKTMSAGSIITAYRNGERNFSEVICTNESFEGLDLNGIIFRKANLGFCSFRDANLQGADFSHANLEWTNFSRADLRNANFQKSNAVWSVFNGSQFEKTNMNGADLSWSLFFNTNLYGGANLTNAITATIATKPEEITEEGLEKL